MATKPGSEILTLPRITTLATSLLVALSSGTNYVVSAYAPQLGSRLRLTHTQLNYVTMAGNVGVYTSGPLWGRLVDARGPRPLFASAFVFMLSGYSGIRGLFDTGLDDGARLSKLHLGLLIFCGFLTGLGSNAGVTSAINASAKSFPDISRGTVVGIVISGFGLSAFFFSSISHLLFPGNTSDFLLILALGTSLPMILGFFFVRRIPLPSRSSVYAIESGRGATSDPQSPYTRTNSSSTHLLAEPEDDGEEVGDQSSSNTLAPPMNGGVQLSPSTSYDAFRAKNVTSDIQGSSLPEKTGRNHDISGRGLWTAGDFWLLFCTNMLLSGTGLMYINNVGTISQALFAKGNPDYNVVEAAVWQAAQVSIVSVANFVGRIFIGITADFVKSHLRYPRSFCITIVSTLFITSQLVLLGADSVRNLWQASALLGFAYGSMFGLFPTVTIEWFGLTHFSENWGFVSLAPVVGGNLFSIAFGRILDAHDPPAAPALSVRGGSAFDASHQCLDGRECYIASLYLTIGACVVALGLGVWAGWRDWRDRSHAGAVDEVPWEVIAVEE